MNDNIIGNKDVLVLLVAKSGAGKTTLAKLLYDEDGEEVNVIQSYATRKPREENEFGHIFVGEKEKEYILKNKDNILAYADIYGTSYWATKDQYRGKGMSVYVVDVGNIDYIKSIVTDCPVFTINLTVSDDIRRKRLTRRYSEEVGIIPVSKEIEKQITDRVEKRMERDEILYKNIDIEFDYVLSTHGDLKETYRQLWCILEDILDRI